MSSTAIGKLCAWECHRGKQKMDRTCRKRKHRFPEPCRSRDAGRRSSSAIDGIGVPIIPCGSAGPEAAIPRHRALSTLWPAYRPKLFHDEPVTLLDDERSSLDDLRIANT